MSAAHHKYQYVVLCRSCGIQPLKYDEYITQMRRADSFWECPHCGERASWDDDSIETNPPEPLCDGPPDDVPSNSELLEALRGLTTNKHLNLGDLVYTVREREGEGWEGPAVVAWSNAVSAVESVLKKAGAA